MATSLGIRLRIKRLAFYFLRAGRRFMGINEPVYYKQRVEEYRGYWQEAARVLGAEFVPLGHDLWEVRLEGRHTRIKNSMVQLGDPVVNRIASDKALCYQWAMDRGVPVPPHLAFRLAELDLAKQFLMQNPGVYVVKPTSETTTSVGVTTHISTPRQLENAAVNASLFSERILLDKMVFGESCRLLWLGGEMIHAVRQRGVRVTGDGRSTIAQLLAQQQLGHLASDFTARMTLREQRLSAGSVAEPGREILTRALPPGHGATWEPVTKHNEVITHLVGPALREEISRILEATENEIAGVDIVTRDPSVSLKESGGILLEINPGPGIHKHYITPLDYGENAVAVKILRYLLHPSRQDSFAPSRNPEAVVRLIR